MPGSSSPQNILPLHAGDVQQHFSTTPLTSSPLRTLSPRPLSTPNDHPYPSSSASVYISLPRYYPLTTTTSTSNEPRTSAFSKPWQAISSMLASPKRSTFPLPSGLSPTSLIPSGGLHRQPSEYELAMLESLSATMIPSSASIYSPPSAAERKGNYAPGFGQQSTFINQRYISGRGDGNPVTERKNTIKRLEREARDLVAQLQFLVTSQERALNLNRAGGGSGGGSNGDSGAGGLRRKKPLTVRQARDGILSAMQNLLDVKEAEETFYGADVNVREGLVRQVKSWMEKRGRLEKEVERIENGREGREMEELREKVEGVQAEINIHEEALRKLRSQRDDLLSQISTIQTTITARASTYNSALQTIHKNTTAFLQSPSSLLPSQSPNNSIPFTPDAAVDYWLTESKALKAKRDGAAKEAEALRDGLIVWDECVGMIDRFEQAMAKELSGVVEKSMRQSKNLVDFDESATPTARRSLDRTSSNGSGRSTPTSSFANRIPRSGAGSAMHSRNNSMASSRGGGGIGGAPAMPEDVAIKLVRGIDKTIAKLESCLNTAEDRGWTLLVCCIGAELDSFRAARNALIAQTGVDVPSPRIKGKEKEISLIQTHNDDDDHHHPGSSSPELPMKDPKIQHAGTWETSDAESEIDDPAALFAEPSSSSSPNSKVEEISLPSPRVRHLRSTEQDELEYSAFASVHQAAGGAGANGSGSGSGSMNSGPLSSSSGFVRKMIPADVTYKRPSSVTGVSPKRRSQTISPPPPGMRIEREVLDSPHSAFPPSVLDSEHSAFPPRRASGSGGGGGDGAGSGGNFGEGSGETVRRASVQRGVNDEVD